MLLLVATTIFAQQAAEARSNDEVTAKQVCDLITRYHISHAPIDDKVSERVLERYLRMLDSQKLYFTKQDVSELDRYRKELDNLLKAGKVDFAYETHATFLKRLDERMELAHGFIDIKHDFTADEQVDTDLKLRRWAADRKEINERWRKRIKYELLVFKLDDTDPKEARERLHKRYRRLQKEFHNTEQGEALEMYLTALAEAFDPHSRYMSPDSLKQFEIDMRLSLDGIGAALKSQDGITEVAEIVTGGAAEKDGRLKIGDKIVGVAQAEGEFVDIIDMKIGKVVRQIRGDRGTVVRLKVRTADTKETKIYDITRAKIQLDRQAVRGEIIESGERLDGRKGRIGVINIPTFYRDFSAAQRGDENFRSTSRDVRKVLNEFRQAGDVSAIIVDVRNNGGGALSEAIEVSGLFIDQGPVVQVKEPDGSIKSHDDVDAGVAYSGPLVVICNRLSASASEIFAGAIQDYGRGIVVGDTTTHGKGTVQNVMPVSRGDFLRLLGQANRGALKLTISQFYRVNGDSTQNQGVRSDVVLPSLLDHFDLGESFLENALAFDQVAEAKHAAVNMTNANIRTSLRKNSQKRVASDADFQKLQEDVERFEVRKKRKSISLNEAVLRKEREEDKKKKKEEEEKKKDEEKLTAPGKGPVFPEGFYNNELLEITLDYVNSWRALKNTAKR
ncbi:MAG: tail-specific protease [Planctomycetaceae bacterium]|nr:tail-specific protease [Planctomycetaceae bacterium]